MLVQPKAKDSWDCFNGIMDLGGKNRTVALHNQVSAYSMHEEMTSKLPVLCGESNITI